MGRTRTSVMEVLRCGNGGPQAVHPPSCPSCPELCAPRAVRTLDPLPLARWDEGLPGWVEELPGASIE